MRPIRIVLVWQLAVTAALAVVSGFVWGASGAVSAALGGAVNLVAGCGFAFMVSRSRAGSAGEALRGVFRAEAMKILLILVLLPAVLTNYRDIVHVAFFSAFVVTVIVFAAAIAIRDTEQDKPRAGDR